MIKLTKKQHEALQLTADGLETIEIAKALNRSVGSINDTRLRVKTKYKFENITHACVELIRK